MKKKLVSLLLTFMLIVSTVAGCGSATGGETEGNSDDAGEDTFTMAISYMPDSLQPDTDSDDYVTMVRPIYEPLFSETGEGMEYYLADDLKISEDGLTYTIHLNSDATWSDGEPITVKDILFSIDYAAYSAGGTSSLSAISGQSITFNEIDEKTLEITLPEPYMTYITTLANRLLIIPAHAFDSDPSKVDDSGYFNSTDMATSGAYTVAEINEDSIVYVARDDYYRGTPDVKKIVLQTMGAGSSKQVAFENGEISYMRITTAEELEKYKAQEDKYNIFSVSESRLNYLQINPYGPANLSDDARKAIFLALNVEEIVDVAYGSDELAVPANSLLTPDQSYYNPECKGYKQNLEEAKALARSSGLEGKTLTYIYNADRANMEAIATIVQQQLAEIGVNLSIEGLDSTTFFSRFFAMMYKNGQEVTWDLGSNGWDSERGSSGAQAATYIKNSVRWGFSEETANLAIKANSIADSEEAQKIWDELIDKALGECWEFPLTYTNYVMVSQKNITGLDGTEIVPEFTDWLQIKVD